MTDGVGNRRASSASQTRLSIPVSAVHVFDACASRQTAKRFENLFMTLLLLLLAILLAFLFIAACTNPNAFDILRSKTEDLGMELHERGTWRDIWMNLVPRGVYPKGAGYVRSTFQIARSEPGIDEEGWEVIQNLATNAQGANITTYNQVFVGHHEDQYKPEKFGLMGPLINQDDLAMYWHSEQFWNQFFQTMEKRNIRSASNRLGNIYRQYCYKASAQSGFTWTAGDWTTQPSPQAVDLSTLITQGVPTSELTQEMLDSTAEILMQEGAQDGDTNGWISLEESGPAFPLYIGTDMSNRLLLNNSELRQDYDQSFMGRGDINPVIKRIGAKRVIKNFRHVINLFPARWALMSNGDQIPFVSTGMDRTTGVTKRANLSVAGSVGTLTITKLSDSSTIVLTLTAVGNQCFVRIPTYAESTAALDATKGQASVVNGCWRDPQIAAYESVEVLNPLVFTEEVLMPVNSLPGAKLSHLNYFGEWDFVTGNDALLGIAGCTGITDPLKKQGRHFGEYRHAARPTFPIFGRLILFKRCAASFDTVTCS